MFTYHLIFPSVSFPTWKLVTVDSSGAGVMALTVKPYEALGGTQAPTKSVQGQLPRLQPAPSQQLNSIAQMENVRPVTSTGNVSHVNN
jgi:hypothetical protein